MIGEGTPPDEATEKVGMVVEGIFTAVAAKELAAKAGVEMPITEGINDVIDGKMDARAVVETLMTREKKSEQD